MFEGTAEVLVGEDAVAIIPREVARQGDDGVDVDGELGRLGQPIAETVGQRRTYLPEPVF